MYVWNLVQFGEQFSELKIVTVVLESCRFLTWVPDDVERVFLEEGLAGVYH